MSLKYSFDKKTMRVVMLGLGGLAILIFVAGLLVGIGVGSVHSSPSNEESIALDESLSAPSEPAEHSPETSNMDPTDEPDVARHEPNESEKLHADLPTDLDRTATLSNAGIARQGKDPQTESPFETSIELSDSVGNLSRGKFAVQVGSFLVESNARRLLEQLESRGYRSTILKSADNLNRTWYSVRFGEYSSETEALRAAGEYAGQAKHDAVVRPAGVL
ncbi:MAG TPA: SPOR domain-containing protein [Blastocatellia bacterium]|nr:SPOR domain-containing protein [Blastocatellia bacterium]